LDLSIARIRLLMAAILQRETATFKRDAQLVEWSTKMISTVVAASSGENAKQLMKQVAKISLNLDGDDPNPDFDEEDADTPSKSAPGADNNQLPDYVIHGSQVANNRIGSTEALLGGLR
jgi:hypothetical protein